MQFVLIQLKFYGKSIKTELKNSVTNALPNLYEFEILMLLGEIMLFHPVTFILLWTNIAVCNIY